MIEITVRSLQLSVKLGCTSEERSFPQIVECDLDLHIHDSSSLYSDDLKDTVDYMCVIGAVENVVKSQEFQLVEHLAHTIGKAVLAVSVKIHAVKTTLHKRVSPVAREISCSIKINC